MIYYPARTAACRWCWCRGPSRSTSGCRCRCGGRRSSTTTRTPAGWRCARETLEALQREKLDRGLATLDACVARAARRGARVTDGARAARRLAAVRGLRALPVHARGDQERDADAVRDRLSARLRGDAREHVRPPRAALRARGPARRRAERRGAVPGAPTASATRRSARRVALPGAMVGALAAAPAAREARVGDERAPPLRRRAEPGRASGSRTASYEVVLRVENRTLVRSGLDRAGALARSLLSTHPDRARHRRALRLAARAPVRERQHLPGARHRRPTTRCVGAAIVLPDHPQIAPESRGGLFDSTEIEEALLLHVHALSDGEREEIERQDPAVREMVARAAAATPEDIVALHGRVTLRDPRRPSEPPSPSRRGLLDPTRGRGVRRGRRRHVPARRQGRDQARPPTPTCTRACSTGAPRRSSGSSPTTTAGPTSA